MANDGKPLPARVLAFVASLPAAVLARASRRTRGGWLATVDCGPSAHVSDAAPLEYAETAEQACEQVKAWLLDDLAARGRCGNPRYQPHWSEFDVRYRLGTYWRQKAKVASGADPAAPATTQSQLKRRPGKR